MSGKCSKISTLFSYPTNTAITPLDSNRVEEIPSHPRVRQCYPPLPRFSFPIETRLPNRVADFSKRMRASGFVISTDAASFHVPHGVRNRWASPFPPQTPWKPLHAAPLNSLANGPQLCTNAYSRAHPHRRRSDGRKQTLPHLLKTDMKEPVGCEAEHCEPATVDLSQRVRWKVPRNRRESKLPS